VLPLCELRHELAQFQHLYVRRTSFPVVPPADDQIALAGIVSELFELEAFIFKLNAEVLPTAGLDFDFGFTVGKAWNGLTATAG
jgi:hypothetical protein